MTRPPPRPARHATRVPASIAVLTCSYRRPGSLLRGLGALALQERRPDEVIVVIRDEDAATHAALASRPDDGLPLRIVTVAKPGTVHALNAGLAALRSDVVCITDDDTVPWPDWTARILAHFRDDPALGGVGGRDWMHEDGRVDDRSADTVGKVQYFGRVIGNHHLGVGPVRPVDLLKGANMSYRAEAIADVRFDRRLRGTGAVSAEDQTFSIAVKRSGWKLAYDPAVALDHYSAARDEPRHYSGIARTVDGPGLRDHAHNEVVSLWSTLDTVPRRVAYAAWSVLVGTRVSPGLLQAIRFTPQLGVASWTRMLHIQRGKLAGVATMLSRSTDAAAITGRQAPHAGQQARP